MSEISKPIGSLCGLRHSPRSICATSGKNRKWKIHQGYRQYGSIISVLNGNKMATRFQRLPPHFDNARQIGTVDMADVGNAKTGIQTGSGNNFWTERDGDDDFTIFRLPTGKALSTSAGRLDRQSLYFPCKSYFQITVVSSTFCVPNVPACRQWAILSRGMVRKYGGSSR